MTTRDKHRRWPEPTIEEPPFEELEQALLYDGEVLATDGCEVEPDGVCPHGYPAWPRYLGLI